MPHKMYKFAISSLRNSWNPKNKKDNFLHHRFLQWYYYSIYKFCGLSDIPTHDPSMSAVSVSSVISSFAFSAAAFAVSVSSSVSVSTFSSTDSGRLCRPIFFKKKYSFFKITNG